MKKGQLLIEVMIAISIAMVAIVGLVQVANRSVNNSGGARRQSEATTYGTEAIEWVVAQKDKNSWEDFVAHASGGSGTAWCFSHSPIEDGWSTAGPCGSTDLIGQPLQYVRDVVLTANAGNNEVAIDVTVSWQEGNRTVTSKQSRTVGRY